MTGANAAALRAPRPIGSPARRGDLRGAIVVVKYGGAVMGDEDLAGSWAADIAALSDFGVHPVVVHGGGSVLTRTMARMGLESTFVDGHRVTTREGAEIAEMVLSGRINKEVVSRLTRAGVKAIGLSGTDGCLLEVRPHRPRGRDIGFVGEVAAVDPEPLRLLITSGYVPVLSSTATSPSGEPYNINADLVAAAIAPALGAARLVFLSDVPGLLLSGERVEALEAAGARALLAGGGVTGGMRPKLEGAIAALEAGVPAVHVLDGRERHILPRVLVLQEAQGTVITRESPAGAPAADGALPGARPDWAGTLAARGSSAVMATYARFPLEIVSGNGSRVIDGSGRSYLDFVAGIAVNALGHGHPAVARAIRSASSGLIHASNLYWTEPMVRLAERLAAVSGMERAFFCTSGAEAIETAIKVARKARPGRGKIVVFERSFHGRTLGALSATIQAGYQDPFRPLLPGFVAAPYGDFEAAARMIDEQTAAVLAEPVQGEGGVRPAPEGWLEHLRRRSDGAGALLILDEVQTGLGRTGTVFAYQADGVRPDAVACAKALAGGLPMGALLARGDAAGALGPGEHGSTFGGGPFVATIAHAVLDVILEPRFLDAVAGKGERLGASLGALAAEHAEVVAGARGRGLMWGLVLREPRAPELVELLQAAGLLTLTAGKEVLRLLPPLSITASEIDEATALIAGGLARLARGGRES